MKKKILSIALAVSMLSAASAAFAETINETLSVENTAVDVVANETPAVQKTYTPSTFTVEKISEFDGFKAMLVCNSETSGETHLTIADSTLLVDNQGNRVNTEDIKAGDTVTMYYHINTPTLMIMPPRYIPNVLVVNTDNEGFTDVDTYTDELVNQDNTLALNIGDNTVIEYANGAKIKATAEDLKNADLAVFYTNTTRSIPAQTTPSKVIILSTDAENEAPIDGPAVIGTADTVLDDAMAVDAENYAVLTVNGNTVDAHFVELEGVTMLPIRAVAEAMGLEVKWDDNMQSVSVGTTQMGVFLKIGENSYSKAKMMPAELESAPMLIDAGETSLTYVPVSFFSEILTADVQTDETTGSISITYAVK